jgi:hypothetical protein
MVVRTDTAGDVLRDLPAIVGMEALRAIDHAMTHPGALRGYLDLFRLLPGPLAVRPWLRPYPFRARLRALLGPPR